MSNLDLEILARNRKDLLLVEAIGWLHDYRKCSDEHLRVQAANLSGQQALPRNELGNRQPQLSGTNITLLRVSRTVTDLLDDNTWNNDVLGRYISRCHKTSHFDKQEPVGGKQNHPNIKLSTPFGFEKNMPSNLTQQLWNLPWTSLCNYSAGDRNNLLQAVGNLFSQTVADTRRPINEVDLWSWGLLVGALYKAALAGALLTNNTPRERDLHWRLLAIRVPGLDYLFSVERIPDLLARQELLTDCLERIRRLLEVTYPLGSEVYRDENGSLYVVPDVPDLLDKTNRNGVSPRALILREFEQGTVTDNPNLQIGSEMRPHLELESIPWWGQDPGWPQSSNDNLPDVSTLLARKVIQQAEPAKIREFWQEQTPTDICTVCGLRPQGPSQKATERNVCDICERRRADRSREWATEQLQTTIWTNEVADENGRMALIVGTFDLTHWLSGDLVRTLAVREPNDANGRDADRVAKNPSFARLRRVWETTRRFWQEVCPTNGDGQTLAYSLVGQKAGTSGPRLEIKGRLNPNQGKRDTLGPYHAYELVMPKGVRLSVVWDEEKKRFITAENLEYLAGKTQLGEPVANFLKKGNSFTIEEPTGYGAVNKVWGSITLIQDAVELPESAFVPAIPVLAEPRTFMTVAPADKALEILSGIKAKYEREIGKVQNRLPLHLGVVFAHRRTPFRAILDAGRQMLRQTAESAGWKVICRSRKQAVRDSLPKWFTQDNEGQFSEWFEVTLKKDDHCITWYVPAMMGDGQTEDKWYPYIFLDTQIEPSDRSPRIRTKNPWSGQDGWLHHVRELRPSDVVYFTPSTFDYEFLDVASRRFEIHYDRKGRRTTRRTRPYYLEDLDRFDSIWNLMKLLKKAQRYQVLSAIEATREVWFGEDREKRSLRDATFRQFVADTLAGAEWPKGRSWKNIPEQDRGALVNAGVRGELADLAELHMEILKEN